MKWKEILLSGCLPIFMLAAVACQPAPIPTAIPLTEVPKQTPVALIAKSCSTQPIPFPNAAGGFVFENTPELWIEELGSTDTFLAFSVHMCQFDKTIRFISFRSGYMAGDASNGMSGHFLSCDETIRCFRTAFFENSNSTIAITNSIAVETVKFSAIKSERNNCVIQLNNKAGIVAFWYKAPDGFALVDLTDEHLKAGVLEKFLAAFKFK